MMLSGKLVGMVVGSSTHVLPLSKDTLSNRTYCPSASLPHRYSVPFAPVT